MTSFDTKLIQISIFHDNNSDLSHQIIALFEKNDAIILSFNQNKGDNYNTISLVCNVSLQKIDALKDALTSLSVKNRLSINFNDFTSIDYEEFKSNELLPTYVLILVGKEINTFQLAEAYKILNASSFNITSTKKIGNTSFNKTNQLSYVAYKIEVSNSGSFDIEPLIQKLKELAKTGIDFSFQKENIYQRSRRLICFDMDSTLIQTEVIDELAIRAGVGDEVKAITESAMRGEIDFKESFAKRVSLLKGLDESVMIDIAKNLPYTKGLDNLMTILKKAGYKTAILSGGFTYFANHIKNRYNIDYIYANNLEITDGKLTGKYLGDVVDARRKVEILHSLATKERLNIQQTVVVGDGANDLPMIKEAGLGIAFHAKPKVQNEAPNLISTVNLDGIIYFLGYSELDLIEKE